MTALAASPLTALDRTLIAMRVEGAAYGAIDTACGKGHGWAASRARTLAARGYTIKGPGADPQVAKDAAVAVLRGLVAKGLSDSEIAAELGITRNAVIARRHRSGIPTALREKRKARPAVDLPAIRPSRIPVDLGVFAPRPGAVTLLALAACGCRWPCDGAEEETLFCGEPAGPGGPYCPLHAGLAKGRPAPIKRATPAAWGRT